EQGVRALHGQDAPLHPSGSPGGCRHSRGRLRAHPRPEGHLLADGRLPPGLKPAVRCPFGPPPFVVGMNGRINSLHPRENKQCPITCSPPTPATARPEKARPTRG